MRRYVTSAECINLFIVKGWRAGCCLGIQMILGELRLGLPNPELPMLLVLPLIPMPWPTWEWFSMFLFIGNVPLFKKKNTVRSSNNQFFLCHDKYHFHSQVFPVIDHIKVTATGVCIKWETSYTPAWWWRGVEGHGRDSCCGGDMTGQLWALCEISI